MHVKYKHIHSNVYVLLKIFENMKWYDIVLSLETSSNIRRDITAETSLMNDLDKRINYELDSPRDARFNPQNVNLISLNSDENLQSNNQSWCFNGGSKTNSDNASLERYGKSFNYLMQIWF